MPRAALTRLRVVGEARRLVERDGLDHLTLSALASRLGVKPPSLYRHIGSIAELQRTISTIAAREFGNEIERAARGRSGRSAIYAMSHGYRSWAVRHPHLYRASHLPAAPGDSQHQAVVAAVARTFAATIDTSLTGDIATQVDRTRAARAALHGFITLESARSFGVDTHIDRSFDRIIHGLMVVLEPTTHSPERVEIHRPTDRLQKES